MKKNFYYALMSAIALTSAVSFTACSSDDGAVAENVNPTYDGTSVRTDFAFSVTKASQGTRMTAGNTQNAGNFLGMSDMYLFPFAEVPTVSSLNFPSYYSLGSLSSNEISSTQSSKVYTLSIPVGTNNFLFYGKATRSTDTSEDFTRGKLSSNIKTASALSGISFSLQSIQASLGPEATAIAGYLTAIANATYTPSGANPTPIAWSQSASKTADNASFSALSKLYTEFTKNQIDRSGSVESVVRMVLDLYKSAYAINAQSTDTDVKGVAGAICKAIEDGYGTSGKKVLIYTDSSQETLVTRGTTDEKTADNWTGKASGFTANFPANLYLPMGAALMKWHENAFIYVDNPLYNTAVGSLTASTSTDKYRYPAEIVYYDNSPLIATTSYKKIADYPKTPTKWNVYDASSSEEGFTNDWSETSVSAATRAVAMKNNVNYGVALLETTVALKEGVTSTALTDNRAVVVPGETNQNDLDAANFIVTGLLIGGQPASVDWNMVNPDDGFAQVIYDKEVVFDDPVDPTAAEPVSKTLKDLTSSIKNYTIVLDNFYSSSSATQKDVRIALQLKNNGKDFYGANGLIPAGSTFYLVGDLALSSVSGTHTIPNVGSIKRNADGSTYRITEEGTKRVFIQDYKTVANITIPADALSRAYSIIPDLRSTEVLFGLSVDMDWETGLTFGIEL